MFNVFERSLINNKRQQKQRLIIDGSISKTSKNNRATNNSVLPFILTPISMAVFLFSSSASAACKDHDCVCSPSELTFATPTTEPGED